ncbi:hypothetical protein BDF14DRAFT_1872228 [Spinellus fusiger]|nr:hypothetical protein BDF14DRAFT_1872228 [Spinellus fusiger]
MYLTLRNTSFVKRSFRYYRRTNLPSLPCSWVHTSPVHMEKADQSPTPSSVFTAAATTPTTATATATSPAKKKSKKNTTTKKHIELLSDERLQYIIDRLVLSPPVKTIEAERLELITNIDSHYVPSRTGIISHYKYEEIYNSLDKGYRVDQLKDYLKAKEKPTKGIKADLLTRIIKGCWSLTSQENVLQTIEKKEAMKKKLKIPASHEELFFIIGNNGATLKKIEKKHNVSIVIDTYESHYVLEGLQEHIQEAEKEIHAYLSILREDIDVLELKDDMARNDLAIGAKRMLSDISKMSDTYIYIENNKFRLAALTQEALENGKRHISLAMTEMGFTNKKPLTTSDHTLLHYSTRSNANETVKNSDSMANTYSMIPMHDTVSMPLSSKSLGWSRILQASSTKVIASSKSCANQFYILSDTSKTEPRTISFSGVRDILQQTLQSDHTKHNISVEAIFGHLLIRNPLLASSRLNILKPSLTDAFNANDFQKLINDRYYQRRVFLPSHPPSNFTAPLIPIQMNEKFHRRVIQAHYVSDSLLATLGHTSVNHNTPETLQRLSVDFMEQENGSLEVKKVIGEHKRTVVDTVCVAGHIDARILAKQYTLFTREPETVPQGYIHQPLSSAMEEMLYQCKLTAYSELSCPTHWSQEESIGSGMTLVNVSFRNEKLHCLENSLVTMSHVEEQEGHTQYKELKVTHVGEKAAENAYLPIQNGIDSWDTLTKSIIHLAERWTYQ